MQKHPDLPQAFADLGIETRFLKAIHEIGFTEPSDIQRELIPVALAGKDVFGQARTGTGKTAAFGLPILQQILPTGRLQAICLAPTRELAVQVTTMLRQLAMHAGLHIVAVYGGQKMATQIHQLGKKPHMVVGTPGRMIDFMRRGMLDFSAVRFAVLDEVDRMLDIGFRDDINMILGRVPRERQTIFVSATIDDEIKRLARQYMHDPVEVNVSCDRLTVDEVDQTHMSVERYDKFHLLRMLLTQEKPPVTIVFCNTKHAARKLSKKLYDVGINAKEIHGDLDQRRRDRVMDAFRKQRISVLVATDLAARGIDVSSITHIINYDIPPDAQVYIHRIGRTARMGNRGVAITFVTSEEGHLLTAVEMLINREVPERKVDGFVPRPPPEEDSDTAPVEPVLSRFAAPVFSSATEASGKKLPRKTLGSHFKPSRGRRRL